jgi:hypothetical protein
MARMTRVVIRLATLAATAVLGTSMVGCGLIATVSNLAEVGDLSSKLTASAQATFTAEYRLTGGGTATVVQQPPNAAVLGRDSRFVRTANALLMCSGTGAKATCQRAPNPTGGQPAQDQAAYLSAVAGGGFVSTPMAIALIGAASVGPDVRIAKSHREVAGLASTCLRATGIAKQTGPNNVEVSQLRVCVADNGVLATFTGTGTDGSTFGVELAHYSTTVDPAAFAAPNGATVVDVNQLPAV